MEPVPESLSDLITINDKYGVIICLSCYSAQTTSSIHRHLLHHSISIKRRREVNAFLEECPFEYTHTTIALPRDGSAPQPHLPIHDGFTCRLGFEKCGTHSISRSQMRRHVNQTHQSRGESDHVIMQPVRLQTWFGAKKARYWIVKDRRLPMLQGSPNPDFRQPGAASLYSIPETARSNDASDEDETFPLRNSIPDSDAVSDTGSGEEDISGIIGDFAAANDLITSARLKLSEDIPKTELDGWIGHTEWFETIQASPHDRQLTREFARDADGDEHYLRRVAACWDTIMGRLLATLKATKHHDTQTWWASPQRDKPSIRPFELPLNSQTISRYGNYWKCFLFYALRTAPHDAYDEPSETGVQFTSLMWNILVAIRQALQKPYSHDQDAHLTVCIFGFCIKVVTQDCEKFERVYESPLMHYLAVLGIDPRNHTFRSAFDYTPTLAGVLYINRLIMLEYAVSSEGWPNLSIEAKRDLESVQERVHAVRHAHLVNSSYSPTSYILSQLQYGQKLNRLHQAPSSIHWNTHNTIIYFKGEGIDLAKIGVMWVGLLREALDLLRELLFQADVDDIDLTTIVDSMSWSTEFRGDMYNFTKHQLNGHLLVPSTALAKKSSQAPAQTKLTKPGLDGKAVLDSSKSQDYLTTEKHFLQLMMVLVHSTGGMPARGPELGSTKISNSVFTARGWYAINDTLCFLTMYDKSRRRRGHTEYIVRYLPPHVAQLLVRYLVYVRPFARDVELYLNREVPNQEYLFRDPNGPWAGEELTRALSKATSKYLGVRLTVSSYRHVAIGIANKLLGKHRKVWASDHDDGDEYFADGVDEDDLQEDSFQQIVTRQSSHGRHVADHHYAIDGQFLSRLGPAQLELFHSASVAWQALHMPTKPNLFGRDPSAQGSLTHRRRPASQQLVPSNTSKRIRSHQDPAPDTLKRHVRHGLERIYGFGAKAKSAAQQDALEMVHQTRKDHATVIVILPTGAGKSALFLSVAAVRAPQTVVVVVPFRPLIDHVLERASRCGLRCQEWKDSSYSHGLSELIVVSADKAVTSDFLHFSRGLQESGAMAMMFFDECHVAITDISYRERLRELYKLRHADCPIVYLTATLPPVLMPELRTRLLIPDAVVFRRPTARLTIRYVVQPRSAQASDAVQDYIQAHPLPPGMRGIIFVKSISSGEALAEKLDAPFYAARSDHKSEILSKWDGLSCQWIVATGVLGTGVDFPRIHTVLNVGRPWGLITAQQQGGRGGREGHVSNYVILGYVRTPVPPKPPPNVRRAYCFEEIDEKYLTQYLETTGCRRAILDAYFDGITDTQDCFSVEGVPCDNCQASEDTRQRQIAASQEAFVQVESSGRELIGKKLQQSVEADEQLMATMKKLHSGCLFCWMSDCEAHTDHSYDTCPRALEKDNTMGNYHSWRRKVRFGECKHCWTCGLSQELCRRLETSTGQCEYDMVMLPLLYMAFKDDGIIFIAKLVGFEAETDSEVMRWAQQRDTLNHKESNWMLLWRKICVLFEEKCARVQARKEEGTPDSPPTTP